MRQKRTVCCLSMCSVLLILYCAGVSSAGTTGKIAGRIVDTESGEPLPFANVIVEGTSMGAASDFEGYYVILNIPPGPYTLRASMIGYRSMRVENINVSIDLTTTIDFQLQSQVIALGEAITVTAERQMVVKDLTASTAIVEAKQMEALPITEINEALQLQAGIVDRDGLHLRGGRSGEIAYWIDGVPVTDVYDGNQVVDVGKGMVQEMQLVSGAYNAEYGQAMSGIVNIATKQGSNEFSGSITGYIGDYASDNDHVFRAISRVDPFAIRNFEGSLSGAIIKDKLFFFVNGRGIHFDGWQYGQRLYNPNAVTGPLFELENAEVDSFPVERIPSWYWDLEEIDSSDYVRRIWEDLNLNGIIEEDECVDTVVYDLPVYGLPTWYLEAFAPEYLSRGRATDEEGHFQAVQYILGSNVVIDSHLVINDGQYEGILDAIIPPEHRNNPDTIAAYTGQIVDYFRQIHKGGMGDGEYVPMNWSEKLYNQTKLIYKITPQAQLSYNFIYDGVDYRDYERTYQYNPDGDVERHRRGYVNILKFTHTLSSKVFYESSLSYFLKKYWHSVYDNRDDTSYVHDHLLIDLDPYSFHTGGTNNQRFKRDTQTWLGKADWTAQATRIHQLKWGTEFRHHSLFFEDVTVQPDSLEIDKNLFWEYPYIHPQIYSDTTIHTSRYEYNPIEFSGYIQDKIEFKNFIVNIGFRVDYFDPDARTLTDETDPEIYLPVKDENKYWDSNGNGFYGDEGDSAKSVADRAAYWYKDAGTKVFVSPRFGAAFPFMEGGVIHFSYGHFIQIPRFERLYQNPEFELNHTEAHAGVIGNADLNPEKTVSGEIGLQQQLSEDVLLDVTAYFRDIRDLAGTSAEDIEIFSIRDRYSKISNSDFGLVRGVVLALSKRFVGGYSASVDYTYQVAKASNSDPEAARNARAGGALPEIQMTHMDWDQTHTVNSTFSYAGSAWGFSVIGQYGSGLPYTPRRSQDISALLTNSQKKPYFLNVDARAYKDFHFGPSKLTLFLKVYNIFDRLNEVNVYDDTGRAGFSLQQRTAESSNPVQTVNSVDEWFTNTTHYSEPRRIELGFVYSF